MRTPTATLTIRMPEVHREQLEVISKQRKTDRNSIAKEAIAFYLNSLNSGKTSEAA